MLIDNYYSLDILIDDKILEFNEKTISFSIKDSIYSVFPNSLFTIKDLTSLIQESYLLVEGTKLSISYGIKDNTINSCEYVITSETLEQIERIGNLVGDIDLNLKHYWYYMQKPISAAYKGKISSFIPSLISEYNFINQDIDPTGNDSIHYQPLISKSDFIEQRLTPISFSVDAVGSSFYSFITTDNSFNFKSGQNMISSSETFDYRYRKESFDSIANIEPYSTILSIKKWKEDIKYYKIAIIDSIFRINRNTGFLETENKNMFDRGAHTTKDYLPFQWSQNLTDIQGYSDFDYIEKDQGLIDNQNGYYNYSHRKDFLMDRFMCLLPFNPKLHSGKNINLSIYSISQEETALSNTYSGKYLIEECEHIWNGTERRGYTKIIIARRFVSINTSMYTKANNFIKEF